MIGCRNLPAQQAGWRSLGANEGTVESIVEIGKKLIEGKERLKHKDLEWLATEFYWMNVPARDLRMSLNLSVTTGTFCPKPTFAPSALFTSSTFNS